MGLLPNLTDLENSFNKKIMKKAQIAFSTTLSPATKNVLERFCKQRGIRQNHFVEQAILEKLEDEMDMEIINQREFEDLVKWKDAS